MRALGANRMTEVRCKNTITRHRRGFIEREIRRRSAAREDDNTKGARPKKVNLL